MNHNVLPCDTGSVAYGYEYSGCGLSNLVLTPTTERSLLATITAVAAHTPPILTGQYFAL